MYVSGEPKRTIPGNGRHSRIRRALCPAITVSAIDSRRAVGSRTATRQPHGRHFSLTAERDDGTVRRREKKEDARKGDTPAAIRSRTTGLRTRVPLIIPPMRLSRHVPAPP